MKSCREYNVKTHFQFAEELRQKGGKCRKIPYPFFCFFRFFPNLFSEKDLAKNPCLACEFLMGHSFFRFFRKILSGSPARASCRNRKNAGDDAAEKIKPATQITDGLRAVGKFFFEPGNLLNDFSENRIIFVAREGTDKAPEKNTVKTKRYDALASSSSPVVSTILFSAQTARGSKAHAVLMLNSYFKKREKMK